MDGPFLEYYPSGQLKTEGRFEIVEEYSTIDTIYTFDAETYEPIANIIEGEFWIPRSKKSGNWNLYSEKGELISHEYFKPNSWENDNVRRVEARYWDMIHEITKEIIKQNENQKE